MQIKLVVVVVVVVDSKQIMFPFPTNEHVVGLVTALAMAIA